MLGCGFGELVVQVWFFFLICVLGQGLCGFFQVQVDQYLRWMSMVIEVFFFSGMVLLVVRYTIFCSFFISSGEMKRVFTMFFRLLSRSRVWGVGREGFTLFGWDGLSRQGRICFSFREEEGVLWMEVGQFRIFRGIGFCIESGVIFVFWFG